MFEWLAFILITLGHLLCANKKMLIAYPVWTCGAISWIVAELLRDRPSTPLILANVVGGIIIIFGWKAWHRQSKF